jgi:hypothetical protein
MSARHVPARVWCRGAGCDRYWPAPASSGHDKICRSSGLIPCAGHLPIGGPTPSANLGLKEGDIVRVKSGDEILATVDEFLLNRGMAFHPEMIAYCGKAFRISQRLSRLIDERTGRLKELKNSCLVLEGADCHGTCTRPLNYPRACPPYRREIWLSRVDSDAAPSQGNAVRRECAERRGRLCHLSRKDARDPRRSLRQPWAAYAVIMGRDLRRSERAGARPPASWCVTDRHRGSTS